MYVFKKWDYNIYVGKGGIYLWMFQENKKYLRYLVLYH